MMRNNIIIAIMVALTITISFTIVYISTNIDYPINNNEIKDKINKKSVTENLVNCNCVAFRLDDIQGYWLNEVQLSIIETLHKKNIPITVGIIGSEKFHFGNDTKITNFISEKVNNENHLIEIAIHGWDHESFPTFDKKTQSELIKKSKQKILEVVGISPKVFIPPFNKFNEDTVRALEENGITHFSSMLEMSNPPFPCHSQSVYNFPETSTTGEINLETGMFEKINHEKTFEKINKSLNMFGFAVVTMHPQEFSILENKSYSNRPDFEKLIELELLIKNIQKSNLKTVFLSQINENCLEK